MTGRLRVALVYDDSLDRFGGIPQYVTVLGHELSTLGHDVSLLVGNSRADSADGLEVLSLAQNVTVRFNGNQLSMPLLVDRPHVRALADAFDVVHVQVPFSPLLAGYLIRRLPDDAALVGTFHIASERTLLRVGTRALGAVTSVSRRRFDEVMCVSEPAPDCARLFGIRETAIVPNMIDLRSASPASPPAGPPTIVFVGALVPRKGSEQLVEAFARTRAEICDAQLVIAGDGPLRSRLASQAARLGIASSVELVGRVSNAEKRALFSRAHIACFPARFGESFGVVLLEAIAARGPVVLAGDNPGYRSVLNSVPESLCRADPRSLGKALAALLTDEFKRRRVTHAQWELVQRYDARAVTQQILAVYRRALLRRRGTQSDAVAA